jgi:hypothetical protein
VKARHFVMALRDFYEEQARKSLDLAVKLTETGKQQEKPDVLVPTTDQWALEYITIHHVQPLIEALDDDVSGFVTIAEVNEFTTSRPANWSYVAIRYSLFAGLIIL